LYDVKAVQIDHIFIEDPVFGKMTIRNVPDDVLTSLGQLATQNDRSVEAEARFALRSHVQPLMQGEIRSTRLTQVGTRLTDALDHVNRVRAARSKRPSHVAQAIGEARAFDVEEWFIGRAEPTFAQLEKVANYLGCSREWLQHGDGRMFEVAGPSLPDNPGQAVRWLLDLDQADARQMSFLHLIREDSESGSLVIVKQYEDWHCRTSRTSIHVSEAIGAGGEGALARLSVTLQLLYGYYTSRHCKGGLVIKSYVLPRELCETLRNGTAHPLVALEDGYERPWWEDMWDEEQYAHHSGYWPGWKKLCERIARAVAFRDALSRQREDIANGRHPLLLGEAAADTPAA
jgi:antitoxin FitA